MKLKTMIKKYKKGRRNFSNKKITLENSNALRGPSVMSDIDLSYANLENINLSDRDFIASCMVGTNFENACLRNINFQNSCLNESNFKNTVLHNISFRNTAILNANFENACLRNIDFQGCDLQCTNLKDADLSNADLQDIRLYKVNLQHANLENADLSSANLENANLENANLKNANLSYANLKNANFENALFLDTNLKNTNLENANLLHVNVSKTKGLLNPLNWLKENFEQNSDGFIVSRCFLSPYFKSRDKWVIEEGSVIEEISNLNPTQMYGCGVTFGTLELVKYEVTRYNEKDIWMCLLAYEDLANLCVPYSTNSTARCAKLTLLYKRKEDKNEDKT
jgi:uncharacterized protein YjbI with pentapeptide repeats